MILETRDAGKLLVAKITSPEANLNNSDQFKKEMAGIIEKGRRFIALDFEQVTYVDSSFLGAMVSSLKLALSKGAEIYLTGLKKDILELLRLIRMDKVFKIYSNLSEITV